MEHPKISSDEIGRIVTETLVDRGYGVTRMESQEWAFHLSLNKSSLDGTLEFFFGPLLENANRGFHVPYLIVREETRHTGFPVSSKTDSHSIAQALVARLEKVVHALTTPHGFVPNVGAGLVPAGSWNPPLQDA